MKTLVETSLFDLFASYINGAGPAAGELPAAYDDFVDRLAALSPEGDLVGQLRRLNYTKIELTFMRQACDGMAACPPDSRLRRYMETGRELPSH